MPSEKDKRIIGILFLGIFLALGVVCGAFAQTYQDQRKALSLHYYRGVINFESGQYESAFAEFQSVASVDPYYKQTQQYLASCVKVMDQTRAEIFKGKENDPAHKKAFDLYFLGKSYYEKGDYRRARETFKAVLAKSPEDKYAKYYIQLCDQAMPGGVPKARRSDTEELGSNIQELEKEVSYIKSDIKEQQEDEQFLQTKAERKAARDELIQRKEKQLKEQEELLEEERADYLAQAKIAQRGEKLKKEAEKWKNMKERLASEQPGVPAELIDFPLYLNKGEGYYVSMKEALRQSRWNSAGLNAIKASIYYCDALLIYFYSVKSAAPRHENINRLLMESVKRADVDENVFHMRSILNLKKLIEDEDRPITRSEALFLAQHTEKIVEWCKSMFP